MNLYHHAKNLSLPTVHFSLFIFQVQSNFTVLPPDWQHPFLTMLNPKISNRLLISMNFLPAWKKSDYSVCSFLRYSQFYNPQIRLATPIFDNAQPKKFQSTLNFYEFKSTWKNDLVSSICSGEMVHLKLLETDWLRAFWPIAQDKTFSKRWDLHRNRVNNIRFH